MADNTGISLRAEIDAFTVKSLLMLNGGGVVALLAFTPAIMSKDDYLTFWMLILSELYFL